MTRFLTLLLKVVIPITILAIAIALGIYLIKTGPKQERKSKPPVQQTIEILQIKPQDFQINIHTRGTVAPRTKSTLVSEVSGRITDVSSSFREGSFFDKNEVLINIDRRDYEQALTIVKAELAQAELALSEGQAQSTQAQRDWNKLGLKGKPNDLVLRRPQLKSNKASVAAAAARVQQARTELERTRIQAPYAGRLLDKEVDVGQFVSRGTVLASIYAVDYVEVRLPITDLQSAFLDLPEAYRGESKTIEGSAVTLIVSSAGKTWPWEGRLVRTEGSIDINSRQQFVIVQVDNPYARHDDGRPPLKVGQFVTAIIEGKKLANVIVLPRELVRGKDEVFVVKDDNTVERRTLEVLWRDEKNIVVSKGLNNGEKISKTLLSFATDGMKINIKGQKKHLKAKEQVQQNKDNISGTTQKSKQDNEHKKVKPKNDKRSQLKLPVLPFTQPLTKKSKLARTDVIVQRSPSCMA